jgi:hypothetical protein
MNKSLIGIGIVLVLGFFAWQILKPKTSAIANPGMTRGPYSTPTTASQGGITTGLLSLGTGLANAFGSYENNQAAQNTYDNS